MRTPALLAATLFVGWVPAAPVPKAIKKMPPDAAALVGTWVEVDDGAGPRGTFTFDDRLKMTSSAEGLPATEWRAVLDPEATPRAIDLDGCKGIYELDGEKLTICLNRDASNPHRPTEFKAVARDSLVITLKRVRDEKKDK